MHAHAEIRWVEASYHAVHQVLANPVYAGAYVYGKTRTEVTLDALGVRRKRINCHERALLFVSPEPHTPSNQRSSCLARNRVAPHCNILSAPATNSPSLQATGANASSTAQ
jgi:hypothetical protein